MTEEQWEIAIENKSLDAIEQVKSLDLPRELIRKLEDLVTDWEGWEQVIEDEIEDAYIESRMEVL